MKYRHYIAKNGRIPAAARAVLVASANGDMLSVMTRS
jgi:hypothetical protein